MKTTVTSGERAAALLQGFSLEMTGKDVPSLQEVGRTLPAGTRINVTFLANEDQQLRVDAASAVRSLGYTPVPHLSARRLTSANELESYLRALAAARANEQVFVVGGDPESPLGPYSDALDVVRSGLLEKHGVREVGIAGYPDGHPDIDDARLWEALTDKAAAVSERGMSGVILTQFGFDAASVERWIRQVRERGIELPIRVGVPGPAGVKRLLGYARRFGIASSAGIVEKYGFSLANLLGTAGPDRFVVDLASRLDSTAGDVALHLYTFGGLRASAEWAATFGDREHSGD